MKFFQKLGKALMLPICVLPICGILMGIGYMLCPASIQGGEVQGTLKIIGYLLVKAGSAAIDNMSILFVIGVAIGMSDDGHGAAALAGIASWLVITTLLSTKVMTVVYGGNLPTDSTAYLAFSKIQNPTIGIIAGLIGAKCYNRFKGTKLPDFLAFFSGRRSVSIVTVLLSFAVSVVLALIWPVCFGVMVTFGRWIVSLKGFGSGIYAFFNRLLIPTGMHHALNNVFWFDTIGLGDLTNYWAGKTSEQVGWSLGMYMSGFFPCMIGGVPGAALAIYQCAKNKKKAAGVLFSTAFCAFLCGLTEPFEFSFMFQCFPLYVVYSVLAGIFSIITYFVGFRAGFSFSAGVIDLVFSSTLPAADRTWLIIPLSIAAFAVYYLVFRFMIKKFDLKIIGREETDPAEESAAGTEPVSGNTGDDAELAKARKILKAVGGKENVVSSDCCATRLRLELKDSSLVNEKIALEAGALGCLCPTATSCQVIIGLTVQQMLDAFQAVLKEEPAAGSAAQTPAAKKERKAPAGPSVTHGQPVFIELKKASEEENGREEIAPAVICLPVEESGDGSISFSYIIMDPSGIHARPAGQIVQITEKHESKVTVESEGKSASGSSLVQLMGLGVEKGSKVTVVISGGPQDVKDTAAELSQYFSKNL